MPIRKHGRGWEVRVQHAGRRFSKTVGARQDAFALERIIRGRLNDRQLGRTPRYTLEEAVTQWLTGEAKALRSYDNLLDKVRVMLPHIVGRELTDVVDVADKVKREGMAAGLRPATINRRLAILRRVANLAHRVWEPPWLERDLGSRIKLLPGEEPRYVQATPDQAEKLMQAAQERARAAITWLLLTGLRPIEFRAVQPSSFQGRAIVLTRRTKTGRPRIVPLVADLNPKDFPYGMTESELRKGFEAARAAAGMPWLQLRDLRRTFGSWIVQRTKSLKAAQDLLGHTTPTITAMHYAHLLEGHLREAVDTLPRLRAGQRRGRKKH
jgi:integrase